MLAALRIKNLAIIESLELELGLGFTVLTGETGAGKSILVDALSLVLGGRASAELIKTGAEAAEVEAIFGLADAPAAREFLAAAGLMDEGADEDEVVVRRIISRGGKNRVWIAGKMESLGRLFELGRRLVDIYGQHEYQTLLNEDQHRGLLDAAPEIAPVRERYHAAYAQWKEARDELGALDLDEKKKREREDLLRYRLREIESANLTPDEDDELGREREILKHAELLKGASRFGADYLYESDACALGGLRELTEKLREAGAHDPWLSTQAGEVEQAVAVLEEVARGLASYTDRIEADPARLQQVEDRLHDIKELKRKYGQTIADVLRAAQDARDELDRLGRREELLNELAARVEAREKEARVIAGELRKARVKAGKELRRRVEQELKSLGMDQTRFEARVEPEGGGEGELGPHGADRVAFFLSPNPGEDLKPLSKIASGGELSRIMLALRVMPSAEADVPCLVMDEVDAGIGGAVAEAVGRRMRRLAGTHQTLCVTHLPQIAALAMSHVRVTKIQERGRTWVEARTLSDVERVEELARMLGGLAITETTRAHARELLDLAGKKEGPQKNKSGVKRREGRAS
ncbi:MAG TPA: DNA repair protein RecN [bacterium]|nr:DNA repair protein RecN [bacterium]